MKYNVNQYAQALYQILDKTDDKKAKKDIQNFYYILLKNNNLNLSDKIIEKVEEIDKEKKGITEIKITSATRLNSKQMERLKNLIAGKVEIKESIDPSLIGGLKIQIKDLLIDGSIRAKINQLKQNLIKN